MQMALCRIIVRVSRLHTLHLPKMQFRKAAYISNPYVSNDRPLPIG